MSVATDMEPSWETTAGFESSNIQEFRYDKTTDTLQVDFVNGDTYEYLNVPVDVHRRFQSSLSKGEFFSRWIKNRYAFERI